MLSFLQQRLGGFKEVAGLQIRLLQDEQINLTWIQLKLVDGIVQIVGEKSGVFAWNQLKEFMPVNVPIAVVIDGKGLLHKKVEGTPNQDTNLLLSKAIPNASAKDFYMQQSPGFGGTWVSLVRRQVFDDIYQKLVDANVSVVSVGFGVFPLVHVVNILSPDLKITEGDFGHYSLRFSNGLIDHLLPMEKVEPDFFPWVTSMPLTQKNAIAFAAGFQLFLQNPIEATIESVSTSRDNQVQKHLFVNLGWGVLIFFLGVLLINFLVFEIFSTKNQELRQKQELYAGKLDELTRLQSSTNEKERFLNTTGWISSSKLSFYADRIAATLPHWVLLTKLELQPVEMATVNSQKVIRINTDQIVIQGSCQNPAVLNNWVLQLKYYEWIGNIKVVDYQFDSGKRLGVFTLMVEVN